VDLDLAALVVRGTAARIFAPEPRPADQHLLGMAVPAGAHCLHRRHSDSRAPDAPAGSGTLTPEGEA
jgi:hypothetical protein